MTTDAVKALIGETFRVLSGAIDSSLPVEVPDEVRYALHNNAFIFSGFKSYHTLRDLGLNLINDKGEIKSFEVFRDDVKKIHEKYNVNYLYAEYNHARGSSIMAAKWVEQSKDGDRYYLQYRTAADSKVRDSHRALHGITLPPSDPFWTQFYPPNGWNCRCTVAQVRKDKYTPSDSKSSLQAGLDATDSTKDRMFRFNPGKTLKLFPPKHPYYKMPQSDKDEVERRAYAEYRKQLRLKARERLQGKEIEMEELGKVMISKASINEWVNQPFSPELRAKKDAMALYLDKVLKEASYITQHKPFKDKLKNKKVNTEHFYKVDIGGKECYVIVWKYEDGKTILHGISEYPDVLNSPEDK